MPTEPDETDRSCRIVIGDVDGLPGLWCEPHDPNFLTQCKEALLRD